ncbi:MAG: hypothetical protein E5X57_35510, partial [Mesorhizobium sp.]
PSYQAQIVDDVQTDQTAIKAALKESGSSHPPAWKPADSDKGRAAEVKRRLAEQKQGDPNTRRYLSEPPVQYRAAAATAPVDDLGEDEY